MLADDEHAVHGQLFSSATQRLGYGGVNRETKLLGALAAQLVFGKLIHVGRDDVERWTMPGAATGIADEEAFAHVPGMGVEAPFRRDDGQASAAGAFAGERRDDPGGCDDAGGNVLEKLASCFHLGQGTIGVAPVSILRISL